MIETEFSIILFWIEFGDPQFWGWFQYQCFTKKRFILDEFYACSFNEFLAIFYVVRKAPRNIMFFMQMLSSHVSLDELFRTNAITFTKSTQVQT